ncbi:hydratase [Breznakiellaceae bacterium SP9]
MVTVIKNKVFVVNGNEIIEDIPENQGRIRGLQQGGTQSARSGTIAYQILKAHVQGGGADKEEAGSIGRLRLKFDAMASHDITFVNIVQSAKVSGLERFPIPYVFTNCHNSLCAVGGTINSDDHAFGLSAAKRYGGVFVPPHVAVIHSYMREAYAGCGKMILGSDSHTRYGALGTLGVGEGGGELVKQVLGHPYELAFPKVIAVRLSGVRRPGLGPQDVALAIIGAVFSSGFAKNACLEFIGAGIAGLPIDFRSGIDVMSTETACWSSIWETDGVVKDFLTTHGRPQDYKKLAPAAVAAYDGLIDVDLAGIKPMIALPFHPSNVFTIDDLNANAGDILRQLELDAKTVFENGKIDCTLTDKIDDAGRIRVEQGIIAGCAGGTFDNILAAVSLLKGKNAGAVGRDFSLSIYPGSQPIFLELSRNGAVSDLLAAGVILKTAFCGPCFGAGDVPQNNGLSIRHTTRNFPNREGSKPANGQIASVALMDARSIAASAVNGGVITSAEHSYIEETCTPYHFDPKPYETRVYNGFGKSDSAVQLRYGPNITDWPPFERLQDNLLLKIAAFITDPVTTTDELIPSGETSSFRSNPIGLAEYTLSRKDPAYVARAKAVRSAEEARLRKAAIEKYLPQLPVVLDHIRKIPGQEGQKIADIQLGSAIYANKPGDGSAREQAASCQRVLGGAANFALEYATKRYRSNLINWGMLPFILPERIPGEVPFANEDYIYLPGIRQALLNNEQYLQAYPICMRESVLELGQRFQLPVPELNEEEKEIILSGCLINYYRNKG